MRKLFLGVIAILLIGIMTACSEDEEDQSEETEKVTPVETVEAEEGDLTIDKTMNGRTKPGSSKPIMLENPGELETLEVENGDEVDKDDTIATIKTPAGNQTLYAPQSGQVTNLKASEGDIVSDEDPLAVIADMESMKIQFTVTAEVQKLINKDKKYKAVINDKEYEAEITYYRFIFLVIYYRFVLINDKEYEAEITSIDTMPDDTGLYPVEAEVESEDKEILSGMIAQMKVPEKRIKQALILPTEAIVEESDETFIYIMKDDKAVKTKIEVKETQSDKTAIEGEVKKGNQVIVNGQLTLSDGDKVKVVKESGE